MEQRLSLKGIWEVLVASCKGFLENKVAKLSGSLAYYTLFSMIPLMMVAIFICGIVLGRDASEGEIFRQLRGVVGRDTALQLQELIKNASIEGKNNLATAISVITLVIGATTVFAEIQDSINSIWGLKPKPKKEWLKLLQDRLLSFSVVISLGFILLVSLALSAIIEGYSDRLETVYPETAVVAFFVINHTVTLVVSIIIFAAIFKVLPDAKIRWKDVVAGAVITSLLFMLGRLLISFYIRQSDISGIYGTAGSLVIVLLWTYYSSMILYFGAEFTKAYAMHFGSKIYPSDFAVTIKIVEIETGHASVQDVENKHIVIKEEKTS